MKCNVEKCKAECCGVVPFPKEKFDKNRLVRDVEIHTVPDMDFVIAVDKENYCGFLGYDYKCTIYSDRPEVCRKFGDESCDLMTCPWETKDGEKRCRAERRRLQRKNKKTEESFRKLI